MMMPRTTGILLLLLAVACPVFAQTASAGRIKAASGAAFVVRQKAVIPAQIGQTLVPGDTLRTGADGQLAITLQDETRLSLGPNSDVRLDEFVYSPGEGRLRFVMRIARGLIAYVSGRIAKLSPDAVRLETPSGILGVRGTRLAIRVDVP
jgi:hypothetical protein